MRSLIQQESLHNGKCGKQGEENHRQGAAITDLQGLEGLAVDFIEQHVGRAVRSPARQHCNRIEHLEGLDRTEHHNDNGGR